MANFTSAMIALVDERDRQFLERVAQDFNLPFEQLSKLYLDVSATAIKVPRKYTKKVKSALTIVDATEAVAAEPKPAKEPKAKAEKPAPKAVTIDDLRAAATKCVEAGKKAKLVEINTGFGVAGISKLAPEQYADALKAYEALAAEPEDDPTA